MEQQRPCDLKLDIVENTSVLNRQLNLNCSFDGSNLIYLTGSHLVFQNVFQNTKHFIPRATPHTPLALAFHRSAETHIAIISQTGHRTFLQYYPPDRPSTTIQLHYHLAIHDAHFIDKKKIALLCQDLSRNIPMLLIISSNKKLSKTDLSLPLIKFTQGDHRILLLPSSPHLGCYEFNYEADPILVKTQLAEECHLKDVISIDQAELIVTQENEVRVYLEREKVMEVDLKKEGRGEWGCGVRVGRSVLMAVKGELALGHFMWSQGELKWLGVFEYPQRIRSNILCMQVSADEMNVVIGAQIYHKDTWTMEFFLFNCGALSSEKKFVHALTRLLPSGAQTGDINSLQNLISSEVYLLAGPSIVGYSYVDHIEKKHKYTIHESPRLVAVHPLGFQLLCTFQGAIKFYQKVELQLLQIWSESWSCSSAKYTQSGLLILCIYEQSGHHMILYDPNSFKIIRTYPQLYLKHAVSAIQFDENETEMVLYSGKDVVVYKIKNGEKVSEFREKKEGYEANCVVYDSGRKMILVGMKGGVAVGRKNEGYHLNFSHQKRITIEEDITCIRVEQHLGTIFMGTANGKVLFAPYPLNPIEDSLCGHTMTTLAYHSLSLHTSAVTDILLTHNQKYLFISSKNEGLGILKVRRSSSYSQNSYYSSFDISNYNFIETSSQPYLAHVQTKLKGLLEKRKTIFNELEEYKKEWEARRQRQSKKTGVEQRKIELKAVNNALGEIEKVKEEHDSLKKQLVELETKEEEQKNKGEKDHHSDLLDCYQVNDQLKSQLEQVQSELNTEYLEVNSECQQNLTQIKAELNQKYTDFSQNYQVMRQNLLAFTLRAEIEAQEEAILSQQEIQQTRVKLRKQEDDLYRKNNELKGYITRNKKELQRFVGRRDFIENKQRFFRQQLKYCTNEHSQLRQIKHQLQEQLRQLQADTYKKQKRLRKYFIENKMLLKYQVVHDNLTKTTERENGFMEQDQNRLKRQINELQREIIMISDKKTEVAKDKNKKEQEMDAMRENLRKQKGKSQYLWLQVKELQRQLATVGPGRQQELQGLYQRFFIDKRLQSSLEHTQNPTPSTSSGLESKATEKKIQQQLESHKKYLVDNMTKFEQINAKTFDEIHLNYQKYQGQNYALISECNLRKQQIGKNKRTMQEMVNNVRQTQTYMNQLQMAKEHTEKGGKRRPNKNRSVPHLLNMMLKSRQNSQQPKTPKKIPFVEYEKQQQNLNGTQHIKKQSSESSLHQSNKHKQSNVQVRKMLDINKIQSKESRVKPARRIQTACLNKSRPTVENVEPVAAEQDLGGWMITKPQTASRKRRGAQDEAKRLFYRNKSNSKPTTCTTSHSKHTYA